MVSAAIERAQELWQTLTRAPDGFGESGLVVVGADDHQAGPAGWVAIVRIGEAVVVAAPALLMGRLQRVLADADISRVTDPDYVDALLTPSETRGPALLFYDSGTRMLDASVVGPVDSGDARVRAVIAAATEDERQESGICECTSGFSLALRPDGAPVAVCAWREWPCRIAHMSILTAASHRRCGHAATVAAHALEAAGQLGLVPQWRAASWNTASINLARHLGLDEIGSQYSLRLG